MEQKMFSNILFVLSVIMLVLAFVMGTTTVASAAGTQIWYLQSTYHEEGDLLFLYDMLRDDVGSQSGSINVNGIKHWLSNESAQTDVTFSYGSWTLLLETTEITEEWDSNKYSIDIGEWDPDLPDADPEFTRFNSEPDTVTSWAGVVLEVQIVDTTGTVYQGNYLALKISASANYGVSTDGDSKLFSPVSDPGFPLLELTTGILLGGGLIGLGGYFVLLYKRKRLLETRVIRKEIEL